MKIRNVSVYTVILEIAIVIGGAIWFCFDILKFNPSVYIGGGEYILLTQTHFIWEIFAKCGSCVLWNGLMDGGAPTFAEIHNAPAHPFVFLPAILLGAIDGSKVTLLLAFMIAGLSQWRLSRSMGFGIATRIWTAYVVMFGGHLSGKMENGNVGLVLASACFILLFSELYEIVFKQVDKKTKIRFAVFLTLFMLSGQGYIQIMTLLFILPLSFLFAYKRKGGDIIPLFIEGLIIAFLIGSYFYLPMLRMMPEITKDGDAMMTSVQKMGYSVLNLVIKDMDFYRMGPLGQNAGIYAYYNYIGWFPILLALYGIHKGLQKQERREEVFWFSLCTFLIIVFGSQDFLVKAAEFSETFSRLRFASVITGVAVFPIVALAGLGFEALFAVDIGLVKRQELSGSPQHIIPASKIFLIFIAFVFLMEEMNANKQFLFSYQYTIPEDGCGEYLFTEDTQWVQSLNNFIYPYLFEHHQKVSWAGHPWNWDCHPAPQPYIRMTINDGARDPAAFERVGNVEYILNEDAVYASLRDGDSRVDCRASTLGGGEIDVYCPELAESGSSLVLQENYTSGWKAWMDGEEIPLDRSAPTLTIHNIPKGKHTFYFKYNPWEFWLGLSLTFMGILYCVYILLDFTWLRIPRWKINVVNEVGRLEGDEEN